MCLGISFALQVMQLTLATLLHAFEIATPANEPVDMTETAGQTNFKATPLEVHLTPRLNVQGFKRSVMGKHESEGTSVVSLY
uniref:Secreted protein n=1 Tax=Quercus lobata TaxID=97700 RepID=A0A7N2QYA1_QUELO